jgi:hypothetical protein
MYIRVHTPLRRLGSTNRPLAVLSVVDNDLGMELLQQRKIDMHRELERFRAIIISQVWGCDTMVCAAAAPAYRAPPSNQPTCCCSRHCGHSIACTPPLLLPLLLLLLLRTGILLHHRLLNARAAAAAGAAQAQLPPNATHSMAAQAPAPRPRQPLAGILHMPRVSRGVGRQCYVHGCHSRGFDEGGEGGNGSVQQQQQRQQQQQQGRTPA